MRAESDSFWDELNKVFEQARATEEFKHRMRENEARYARDRAELSREIATLKGYARNVLRDNAMRRFAGNHTSGRKIKTHRLSRIDNDDPRIFEKQEQVGGKSYAICLVVDQSASMRGASKQELAYKTSLVFLEAFDELVETSVIGFSDIGFSEPDAAAVARYAAMGYSKRVARQYAHRIAILHRTYKGKDDPMRKRWCVLPELDRSYSSTPMEAGVDAAVRQLRDSDKDVKVIIVITDGQPNDPAVATKSLREAQRLGIETYGLCIGGRGQANPGIAFLARACDHAVPVESPQGVPQAVYRLLRGVIRARRAA
jgi:Mg-chelatase subunit ChlD